MKKRDKALKRNFILGIFVMLQACFDNQIVLLADPRILAVPIVESNEPLIDLRNQSLIAFGPSPEVPNNMDYTKIRKGVYDKLIDAQQMLPKGLRLCIYEGYRGLALQESLFNARYEELKIEYPDWSHEQLFEETTKLVSPVTNLDGTKNVPPHSTGAAVDVYLISSDNDIVDMGMRVEDWVHDLDGALSFTNSSIISQRSKENRLLMSQVLAKVGFVNYPTEYWHWSFGDRYWAYHKKMNNAIYGGAEKFSKP